MLALGTCWDIVCKLLAVNNVLFQIAGAARGLGRALSCQFAMLGTTVICCDINSKGNEETADRAETLGYGVGHAYAYTCDITKRDKVTATWIVCLVLDLFIQCQ